jgi:DNA modification methylase
MNVARGQNWVVYTADCREVFALPDLEFDHLITDPPYSRRVHSRAMAFARNAPLDNGKGKRFACSYARRVDFGFEHLSPELRWATARIATRAKRWSLAFSDTESSHLWRRAFEAVGLEYTRTLFWDKLGSTPQFTGDRPAVAYEAMTLAEPRSESMTLVHPKGRRRWNGGGKRGVYSVPISANRAGHRDERRHPTKKPLDLMMALVEDLTEPGETIFDPFCGEGTTGVAALRLGRRFIGVDGNPKWAEMTADHLRADETGSTFTGLRAGQVAMFEQGGRRR